MQMLEPLLTSALATILWDCAIRGSLCLSQMVTYYLWWVLWYFKEFKNAKLDKW